MAVEQAISDAELLLMSAANDRLRFERVKGEIIAMAPVGDFSGELETRYIYEVVSWGRKNKARTFSSSAGFKLGNGDVRSPDAAVILPGHEAYGKSFSGFTPGAPDFLIEIVSNTDRLSEVQEKMLEWIDQGCKLAFLIDPSSKRAWVYRSDGSITEYPYTATLSGESVLPGFSVCPAEIEKG